MKSLTVFLFLLTVLFCYADTLNDDFSKAEFPGRQAQRGEWKFENNTAFCKSDPELYKKYKNHGPIIKWPKKFTDVEVEFEMKVVDCQRVVFTLNGDGHIFRVTLADETEKSKSGASKVPTRLIAWAKKSSKQNKGDTIKPKSLPDIPAVNGKWIKVKLTVKGSKGELTIGDFKTIIHHKCLSREKTMAMVTFAHGELSVRNFKLTAPSESLK